jgi:ribose transport system permease protein
VEEEGQPMKISQTRDRSSSRGSSLTLKGAVKWLFGMREFTLVLMIALMFAIIPIFQPTFATRANIITTLLSVATKGIVGIGVTYILVSGALDLSVGGIVALVCAVFGGVYHASGSLALALLCSLTTAIVCGAINGILVTRFRLSAFIATLAMMGIARGITYVLTKGTPIKLTDIPESYKILGTGTLVNVPYVVIMFIVLAVVAHVMLKKSTVLRQNVYTGSNEKAARYSGVNTKRVVVSTFVLIGILCWIAAQMSVARFLTASPSYGLNWEVELIAAAVIGGATLDGGEGSVIGTSLGLILLGFVSSAMLQLGVSVYWQNFVGSFILLVAVLFDAAVESRKRKAL